MAVNHTIAKGLEKLSRTELEEYAAALGHSTPAAAQKSELAAFIEENTLRPQDTGRLDELIEDHRTIEAGRLEWQPGLCPDVPLDEILWRVDSKRTARGDARYISYIDARTAAKTLDEWVGVDGWEATYEPAELAGQPVLWCHLKLHFPDRTVTRSDLSSYKAGRGGTAQEQAATGIKGLVSDAFKRAAAKAGVGRNAYTLPELWLPVNDRGYPPDNIDELIAKALAGKGLEGAAAPRVDRGHTTEDAAGEDETDWTRLAKNKIWEHLGRDDTKAAKFYNAALAETKAREPLTQQTASAVITTAKRLVHDNGAGEPTAEEQHTLEVGRWVNAEHPDDPEWIHTHAARKAVLRHTQGDLPSAAAIYAAMTETVSEPLTGDDLAVLKDGLADPGKGAAA